MQQSSLTAKPMLTTTVIPSIGRATLPRAIESVLNQPLDPEQHEVVVVNDTGAPLPCAEWMESPRVKVVTTHRRERSAARNTGAATASGKYLHFLDDDDWLAADGLAKLVSLAATTECGRIYGGYHVVNDAGDILQTVQPDLEGDIYAHTVAGESIPLGASLIRADLFFRGGGFDPRISVLEDYDVMCKVAMLTPVACTKEIVACFRVGEARSSTDWSKIRNAHRRVREATLDTPDAVHRVMTSANGNHYVRGRVVRAYLSSAQENLAMRRPFMAVSRTAAAAYLTGVSVLRGEYWRGLRNK